MFPRRRARRWPRSLCEGSSTSRPSRCDCSASLPPPRAAPQCPPVGATAPLHCSSRQLPWPQHSRHPHTRGRVLRCDWPKEQSCSGRACVTNGAGSSQCRSDPVVLRQREAEKLRRAEHVATNASRRAASAAVGCGPSADLSTAVFPLHTAVPLPFTACPPAASLMPLAAHCQCSVSVLSFSFRCSVLHRFQLGWSKPSDTKPSVTDLINLASPAPSSRSNATLPSSTPAHPRTTACVLLSGRDCPQAALSEMEDQLKSVRGQLPPPGTVCRHGGAASSFRTRRASHCDEGRGERRDTPMRREGSAHRASDASDAGAGSHLRAT